MRYPFSPLLEEKLTKEKTYWLEHLSGCPLFTGIPTDYPRPFSSLLTGRKTLVFTIGPGAAKGLLQTCRGNEPLILTALMTALGICQFKYTKAEDVIIGTSIHERYREVSSFNGVLAVRSRIREPMSIRELLLAMKRTLFDAYTNQKYPYEEALKALGIRSAGDREPLFNTVIILEEINKREHVEDLKVDLILSFSLSGGGIALSAEYLPQLFNESTIETLVEHLQVVLRLIGNNPDLEISEIDLLTDEKRRKYVFGFNNTRNDYPRDKTIHQLFEMQVERSPNGVAVICEDQAYTYRELNIRANRLASYLQKYNKRPNGLFGICMDHSAEMIIALLGILKSGGAYLPLDPANKVACQSAIVEDAGVSAVLTQERIAPMLSGLQTPIIKIDGESALINEEYEQNPTLEAAPSDLAYVIYTSGSTGWPKGVEVQHSALVDYIWWAKFVYIGEERLDFPLYSSLTFDLTVTSIYTPLVTGNKVIVYRRHDGPESIFDVLKDNRVGILKLTPSHLKLIKDGDYRNTNLKRLIVGGEALTTELAREAFAAFGGKVEIFNEYGPTEATVGCMVHKFSPHQTARLTVPIGRPAFNTQIYILDDAMRPVAENLDGELYIGGEGLARGYLNQAALTAEKFIENPFAPGRIYRSGDIARWLPEGVIEYVGRRDNQVKFNGHRVELDEISGALKKHPQIRDCLVRLIKDSNGNDFLVAYYVSRQPLESKQLRSFLSGNIVEEIIPNIFSHLKRMPLTLNGKINIDALPGLEQARWGGAPTKPAALPLAPLDELVAGVWTDVLSLPAVSPEGNFFDLGGHSLLATQIISRINTAFNVEIPLRSLFESPALGDFTRMVDRILSEQQGDGKVASPPLTRGMRPARLPLSFAQQRLWFLEELWPGSAVYNTPVSVRLEGRLDIEALWRALQEVVRRHEALRTSFASEGGEARQIIHERVEVELALIDLGELGGDQRQRELRRLARAEAARPLSLNRWPLMRAQLVRAGEHEHALLLIIHHIVFDGWSLGVLGRELASLYESYSLGQEPRLEELPVQYADYAVWQREWLAGPLFERQLSYWRKRLEGAPEVQELVGAKRRPEKMGYRGEHELVRLGEELSEGLRRLGRKNGATLFMVLLGGFALLLSKYVGSRDVVVGTDVANRRAKDVEGLIGFFVNMLALRIRVEEEASFRELLDQAREVCLGAYDHQEMPFEKIVEELRVQRSLSHAPLFQVKIVLQNTPMTLVNAPGLSLSWIENSSAPAKLDLTLILSENPEGIRGILEYDINLYDSALISRFASDYNIVLQNVVKRPELTVMELNEILDEKQRRESNENKERRKESNLRRFRAIQPRAINIAGEELVKIERFDTKGQLPLVFKPNLESVDIVDWVKNNCHFVEEKLLKHGAILFRGFKVELTSEFEAFALALGDELFNENGEHPREVISGNVYTPVFYPADKRLLWHNENSFNNRWPMKIWFGCVKPAQIGGETTLVDSRKVFDLLAPQIRDEFIEKNVMYVRNYRKDLGLDWRTVFNTNERAMVEEYCLAAEMEFEWKANDQLMTRSVRPAVVQHPQTKEWVWFNQAQHWHVSCLDGVTRQSMLSLFDENDLPRNCYYGDGSPIEEEAMAAILETYRKLEVSFPWQNGDILLLHNLLTAHGRNPFVGERKLLVAMGSINSYNEVSSQSQKGA